MKKFFPLLIMMLLLVTGCGSDDDKIKIGAIKYLNVTEETLAKFQKQNPNNKHIFFDNMNSMIAALQAGQIDEMSTYESVANYFILRNPNFEWTEVSPAFVNMFCCAMREEDADLKKEFDATILQMTKDGTLSRLVKTYMDLHAHDLPALELPAFYGAETIKIGVTGDLPLLDLIRSDNTPAGFNTAVLAEISNRIEKNFVLVQVDSGARAAALSSGQVDVIFWAVVPQDETFPHDFDKPDGIILTVPYFSDKIVHVKLRK